MSAAGNLNPHAPGKDRFRDPEPSTLTRRAEAAWSPQPQPGCGTARVPYVPRARRGEGHLHGYACGSTVEQDQALQRDALSACGIRA